MECHGGPRALHAYPSLNDAALSSSRGSKTSRLTTKTPYGCSLDIPYRAQRNVSYQRQSGWGRRSIGDCPRRERREATSTRGEFSIQGGNNHYAGALFSIQHRFGNRLTMLTDYTWSHYSSGADFTGELAGSAYQDPTNHRANHAICNFDLRHISNTWLVATTPPMRSPWVSRIVRDWQFAPIFSVRSGIALNVECDRLPRRISTVRRLRPAPSGAFGNLGHDAVTGPAQFNVDLSLSRTFPLRERARPQVRPPATPASPRACPRRHSARSSATCRSRGCPGSSGRCLDGSSRQHADGAHRGEIADQHRPVDRRQFNPDARVLD